MENIDYTEISEASKKLSFYDASCIVANFNNDILIFDSLNKVFDAKENSKKQIEVIVIDISDKKEIISKILDTYKGIRIIIPREKTSLLELYNLGIKEARANIVCCITSNILVDKEVFNASIPYFDNINIFGVAPLVFDTHSIESEQKRIYSCKIEGKFKRNNYEIIPKPEIQQISFTLFNIVGMSIFSKDKFIQLGGYTSSFYHSKNNFYFLADLELAYRAWKAGFATIFLPECKMLRVEPEIVNGFYSPLPHFFFEKSKKAFYPFFYNIKSKIAFSINQKLFLMLHFKEKNRFNLSEIYYIIKAKIRKDKIKSIPNYIYNDEKINKIISSNLWE